MSVSESTTTAAERFDPGDPRFAAWPRELVEEMERNAWSGVVGSVLVSETERVRVWHLRIPPGKRCGFHRHVNPYFWTCHSAGRARGYFSTGEIRDTDHYPGETRHFQYGRNQFMLHSVENIGETELLFTTVEFLDGPNVPLPIPDGVRLSGAPSGGRRT